MEFDDVQVDPEQMAAFREANFRDRMAYVRFKAEWIRRHCVQDVDPAE